MRILIDMDNVMNNFSQHFIHFAKKLGYPIDKSYSDETYHIETCVLLCKKDQKIIMAEIMNDDKFWLTLSPLQGVEKAMKYMIKRGHELVVASMPWKDEERFKTTKLTWLKKTFRNISFSDVIFKKEKWELPGDVIIDDKPEVLEKSTILTVKYYFPYNADVNTDFEIRTWAEFPKVLTSLEYIKGGRI